MIKRPARLKWVGIVRDIQAVVGGGASTANYHEKLSRTKSCKSPLLLMAPGSPSTVILFWHWIRSRILSHMCQSCKGVRCLGDVRSLGHSATLGADQCRSRCGTVPPSVLKLPVDTGHRPKYQRQRSPVDSAPALSRSIYRL